MNQQRLRKLRLTSQILFFALFLFLLLETEFRGSFKAVQGDIRLPYPVGIFLEADPLAAVANALSARALYQGLLWSLVILIPTFFLGRTNPQTPDKLHATQMIRGTRPWMNFKQTIDTLLESPQQPKGSVTGG